MIILFQLILFFAILISLACKRVKAPVWTGIVAGTLVAFSIFSSLPWWFMIPAWLIFIPLAVLFNLHDTRKLYFTGRVFNFFRTVLPSMSATEREAIEAGDVWWDGELFKGNPDWQQLTNTPLQELTEDEQAFLDNEVETLCTMLNEWEIIHEHKDLPNDVWDYLKQNKFFGMAIEKDYGGLGFSALAQSTVVTKISTRSVSAAVNVMVPNSLGPAELLHHYGTDEQKNYYLPRLAQGDEIPCFGLTSTNAGSDAASMPDMGIVCEQEYQGKKVLGIRLSFDKRYITLAPVATLLGVAFKLYDPDSLMGDERELGITIALIPTDHPGIDIGKRHYPLASAFLNGPVTAKDMFIPFDFLIGGKDKIGKGWHMLMECLSIGRGISLPAMATAAGKIAYLSTSAYGRIRRQFNLPIGRFEGVQEALARICGSAYMLEASRLLTATAVDLNIKPAVISAISKCHMTEMARDVMNDAMDVQAGKAIQMGPNNYLAIGYMTMPVSVTVEGANILTRNLIIFGQGAIRCHPYILDEMATVQIADIDYPKALDDFDKLLVSHIGYAVSNFAKSIYYGLTDGYFIKTGKTGPLARYYSRLTRMSTALALVSDMTMLMLGGDLKRKESLSARLGDVLSNLYLASAVLKYYEANGKQQQDEAIVRWCLQTCLQRIQQAFDQFFKNFPNRIVGKLMKAITFPLGSSYRYGPKDKLSQEVAEQSLEHSELRDRLSDFCFVGPNENYPLWQLQDALNKMIEAEPLEKRFNKAIREQRIPVECDLAQQFEIAVQISVLSQHEVDTLAAAMKARDKVIAVDDFTNEQLQGKALYEARQTNQSKREVA